MELTLLNLPSPSGFGLYAFHNLLAKNDKVADALVRFILSSLVLFKLLTPLFL